MIWIYYTPSIEHLTEIAVIWLLIFMLPNMPKWLSSILLLTHDVVNYYHFSVFTMCDYYFISQYVWAIYVKLLSGASSIMRRPATSAFLNMLLTWHMVYWVYLHPYVEVETSHNFHIINYVDFFFIVQQMLEWRLNL